MFNEQEFIDGVIEAAKAKDNVKLEEAISKVTESDYSFEQNAELLGKLIVAAKAAEIDEVTVAEMQAVHDIMEKAIEMQKDSTVQDAKEDTKAEEVTQDVAAEDSAEEAKDDEPEASEEGEAPAKEEEAEKSEQ